MKTNGKGNSIINSQVDIYSEWAIVFCKYAVEYSENIYEREVYYRNLACAYERRDRLHNFGDHMKLIIENYQKSNNVIKWDEEHEYHLIERRMR